LTASLTKKTLVSSAFSSAAQIISKLLGLLSTLVVARVLTPDVFALAAILSITLYFVDVLGDVASETYILQKKRVSFLDIQSAWTLNLAIKICCCLLLACLAPFAARFFEQPSLTTPLQVATLVLPLKALCSVYFLKLKRHLKYGLLTLATFAERVVATILLVSSALLFENVWAFVVADIGGAFTLMVISYALSQQRPVLTLANVAEQWAFSKWLIGKQIAGYLRSQLDTLLVAKFFSSTVTGHYYMARDVAMLPGRFLLGPAIEPLIASFRNEKLKRQALLENVALSYCVALLIASPIAIFVAYFADVVVLTLLGPQWDMAAEYLPSLIFLFFYWVILQVTEQGLIARGKVSFLFYFDVFSLLFIASALLTSLAAHTDILLLIEVRIAAGFFLTGSAMGVLFSNQWKMLYGVMINLMAFFAISLFSAEVAFKLGGMLGIAWAPLKLLVVGLVFGATYLPCILLYVIKLSHKDYRGPLIFIFQEAWTTLSAFRR
tara:strand:- start:35179 stop:36660 length:1482 start_codon:yes stop_codon:yes gene_type:complete